MSKVLKCEHCSYSTTRTYNLKRHQLSKHPSSETTATTDSQNVFQNSQNVFQDSQNVFQNSQNVFQEQEHVQLNKCGKCEKCFSTRYNLERHVPSCKGKLSPNQCPRCLKIFSTRQNKHIHSKRCKAEGSTTLTNITNNITNNNITNNTNIFNNDNRVVNVVINSYGQESMAHITADYIHKRLMEINGHGIVRYVKDVHFNPDIPENHNIRKENNKELRVFEDSEWTVKPLRWSIVNILKKYSNLLKNKMYDEDFKQHVDDCTTWMQIIDNYYNFNENDNPVAFWRSVRDVSDALENIEKIYHKGKNDAGVSQA